MPANWAFRRTNGYILAPVLDTAMLITVRTLLVSGDRHANDTVWNRPNFHTSPAISKSLDHSLASSGLTTADIDIFDLYSCFPIVPKLACHHLGLPVDSRKPITVLGGLTSFGGAGNNYSMHVSFIQI